METLFLKTGIQSISPSMSVDTRPGPTPKSTVAATPHKAPASSRFSFGQPLRSLLFGARGGGIDRSNNRCNGMAVEDAVVEKVEEPNETGEGEESAGRDESWVLKILNVRSLWKDAGPRAGEEAGSALVDRGGEVEEEDDDDDDDGGCDVCVIDDDEKEVEFDRDSFSRLLRKVSLPEARLYAKMSYLGNLTYSIPDIEPGKLLKYQGLRFVTSSVEKRELGKELEKSRESIENQEEEKAVEDPPKDQERKDGSSQQSASAAYQIAASAASYLHSHAKSIIPFNSSRSDGNKDSTGVEGNINDGPDLLNTDMASLMAATDSVTAVVAAEEEVKQAVADDLKSPVSSPCEWFICDDEENRMRLFVIQGSESLASWKANLLFEPIQFEGFDIPVHRGIYEAAKGIYDQMLPEVREHLKAHGNRASFRFTGHSLGGSLSLLINLMLLIRGEVPSSCLLPVITFGAPSVMCGGDRLLHKLGLPRSHVQSITMHRDIVPRAFSCHYPSHVAEILKAVNGKYRNHPCLNNEKLLYAPMGDLLILQPDENYSPHHHLLPSGSGLYVLTCQLSDVRDAEKHLRAAQKVFLSSPHPLEILSDRGAYGSGGTIQRDHDMNSYLKCVRGVIRQELNRIRKAKREKRRKFWWPVVASHSIKAEIDMRPTTSIASLGTDHFVLGGILRTGKESLKRLHRLVSSQHMHLLVLIMFPARLLLLGAGTVIDFY